MTEKVTATMILDAVQASLNGRNRDRDEDEALHWVRWLEDNALSLLSIATFPDMEPPGTGFPLPEWTPVYDSVERRCPDFYEEDGDDGYP